MHLKLLSYQLNSYLEELNFAIVYVILSLTLSSYVNFIFIFLSQIVSIPHSVFAFVQMLHWSETTPLCKYILASTSVKLRRSMTELCLYLDKLCLDMTKFRLNMTECELIPPF